MPNRTRARHHRWQGAGKRITGAALSVSLLTGALATSALPSHAQVVTADQPGFTLIRSDLEFILKQIKIAEIHPDGKVELGTGEHQVGSPLLGFGLRTVTGEHNNLIEGREQYGAADTVFPRLLGGPVLRDASPMSFDPDGPAGPRTAGEPTSYAKTNDYVDDPKPRIISNLIVDQTAGNPAAVSVAEKAGAVPFDHDGDPSTPDHFDFPNVSPDAGLSAPYNAWFTFFGQFFDHGLDLVGKGGSGTVMVPLQPDDPLYVPGSRLNFMQLTRATNQPGPDGILGTADDIRDHVNTTTPFVDQNQTYTSHPSHQVFLREYRLDADGRPVSTGHLLDGADGGLATWAEVKAQARDLLGIELVDTDVHNVPMVATDAYGRFLPGPNGFPRLVTESSELVEGDPSNPVATAGSMRTNHAFLDDIAHNAVPKAGYDAALLGDHYITGDGRGNENIGLTAVHHVFHSEHNRVADHVKDVILAEAHDPAFQDEWKLADGSWNGERLFQAARFVTEMEYQHLVFEEFARKLHPTIDPVPFNESGYHADIDPAISAEFAHVVYRFGHSMLTEDINRVGPDGADDSIGLLEGFLNPREFTKGGTLTPEEAAGSIVRGTTGQVGNEIDEFVTDVLRNNLVGLPLDLATINLARGRETGVPGFNAARRALHAQTGDSGMAAYESWRDFGLQMRHRESLVNFVAAYGTHPTVTAATTNADRRAAAQLLVNGGAGAPADRAAFMNGTGAWDDADGVTTTGLDDVDFWMGGLAEKPRVFGGMLGSTFGVVFEQQLERLQNGDRFYYLSRLIGTNLAHQLEANSFAKLIERNTDVDHLPADVFSRPDCTIELANLVDDGDGGFVDDPGTDCDESTQLVRMNDGTIRFTGEEHVLMVGTDAADRMRTDEGDDTLVGSAGADRLEGGDGNDHYLAGAGDDIMTDLHGDDVFKAGSGDDVVHAGPGFDLIFGEGGKDFIVHGSDDTQTFAGRGDDFILGGDAHDIVAGNEGDDWMEGGENADLLQGDNANGFQNDPNGGNDVIIGGGGNDDYDAEGGDDIMLSGPGTQRNEGMLGFDWVTHRGDPLPANADMNFNVFERPDITVIRDRYDMVEGLSGWAEDDVLRGDDRGTEEGGERGMEGHELTDARLVDGLEELVGARTFTGGNILLGGGGSDLIEGRGGDDLIDGDAWLNVRISVRALDDPDREIRSVDTMKDLTADMLAGRIKPRQLRIVREILVDDSGTDTAVFSDDRASYDIEVDGDVVTVAHTGGTQSDGTDTLRNVERLTFADGSVDLVPGAPNTPASGTVTIDDPAPAQDDVLTAVQAIVDPDGVGAITYSWQAESSPGTWVTVGEGVTFAPGEAEVGQALRVVATFVDGRGAAETVTSPATAPVTNVNDLPAGLVLDVTAPEIGTTVTASGLTDTDGLTGATLAHQWQQGTDGSFADIAGATEASFTVTADQAGSQLRVVVSYTDDRGTAETATSDATTAVPAGAPVASVSTTALTFGTQEAGGSTPAQTVTVTNTGNVGLTLDEVVVTGADADSFTATDDCTTVAPGGSCTIEVAFVPTSAGEKSAQLVITTSTGTTTIALSGLAVEEPAPPTPALRFSDIAGDAHERAILAIAAADVAQGYDDGTYRPGRSVTRGQMATFIARARGLETEGRVATFPDVPTDHAHTGAIAALAAADIVSGYGDGSFRPDAPVTRGQMAKFLANAFELAEGPHAGFPDVPVGHLYGLHIDAIKAAGITEGKDGRYLPDATVTRGQMATFLARALGLDLTTPAG